MEIDPTFNDPKSRWNNAKDGEPLILALERAFELIESTLNDEKVLSPEGCHSRILVMCKGGARYLGTRVESKKEAMTGVMATLQPASGIKPAMFYRWMRYNPYVLQD